MNPSHILEEVNKHSLIMAIKYPKRQCILHCPDCHIRAECHLFRRTYDANASQFIEYRRKKNIEKYISLYGEEGLFEELL